ncbi:MAG: DUF5106 domain-containing protein [Urechidicola sp.]|nr:DUF5106 domain-containing protein [Urechidicola sp.]
MKIKFLLSFAFLFSILTTSNTAAQNTFNFNIKNMANDSCMIGYYLGDKQYVLGDHGKNQMILIDANGYGSFTRDDIKPGVMLLVFPPSNDYAEFIFEGEDLNFTLDRSDLDYSLEINSLSNILLKKNNLKILSLTNKYQDLTQAKAKTPELDIENDLIKISEEFTSFQKGLINDYPDNLFVKMLLANQDVEIPESITDDKEQYLYYKEHFFDYINFKDDWLIRTSFFYPKVLRYLDDLTYNSVEHINESLDLIIDRTDEESEMFQFLVVNLLNKYANTTTYDYTDVWKHLVEQYYISGKATWASEEQLQKIIDSYHKK